MSREELLAELRVGASALMLAEAARCTTAEIRELLRAGREQLAFYERMGLKDEGAGEG